MITTLANSLGWIVMGPSWNQLLAWLVTLPYKSKATKPVTIRISSGVDEIPYTLVFNLIIKN